MPANMTTHTDDIVTEGVAFQELLGRVRALEAVNAALESANRGLVQQVAATEDVLLRLVMERRAGGSTAVEDAFRLLIDAGRLEVVEGGG